MRPRYWNKGKIHLSNNDKVLKKIIDSFPNEHLILNTNPFYSLINSIIGQQISVKAANSMKNNLFSIKKKISPNTLLKIENYKLKKCGLSKQKISYLKNVSKFFLLNKDFIKNLNSYSDEEIRDKLIKIKGIGNWTIDMFLLFSNGSMNILPEKDLGIIKAISKSYNIKTPISDSQFKKLKNKWSPYSSIATWYLWRSLDPLPVSY